MPWGLKRFHDTRQLHYLTFSCYKRRPNFRTVGVARNLALRAVDLFWQARYYDFNLWSERKFVEKLRYIHRNPVARGLVTRSEDWPWSSFRHYVNGESGTVEIESQWVARKRELVGILPTVILRPSQKNPAQAKLERGTLESR
jgi:hypothetical protein